MRHRIAILFLHLLLSWSCWGATLEELQGAFEERARDLRVAKDERITKLSTSYISALKREEAKAQRGGNLEEVLAFRAEIKTLEDGGKDLQPLPATSGKILGELRKTYTAAVDKSSTEHAVQLVELADRMTKALKELEVEMTRGGKIEDAVAVREALSALGNDQELAEARLLAAVVKPAAGETTWRSLKDAKVKIAHRGTFPVGWLDSGLGAAADKLLPEMEKAAAGKPAYVTVPPATVEFRTARPFRKLRFRAYLAMDGGNVEFQVSVKGKVVERFSLEGKPGGKDIECDLDPTQVVEISAADNGSPNGDWAMWIDPQVR